MTLSTAVRLMHVFAAVLAVAVARRRAGYRTVAGFLALTAVLDVGRGIAREHGLDLSTARPHLGWQRVAIHIDQAAYLAWPAAVAWLSAAVFGGSPLKKVSLAIGAAWAGALVLLVAMYPAGRGVATDHAVIACEITSMFFAIGTVVRWWKHREMPTLAHAAALLVCGIHAAAFAVVARGYTVARWQIAVGAYLVLYFLISVVQGGVLWISSSPASNSPHS